MSAEVGMSYADVPRHTAILIVNEMKEFLMNSKSLWMGACVTRWKLVNRIGLKAANHLLFIGVVVACLGCVPNETDDSETPNSSASAIRLQKIAEASSEAVPPTLGVYESATHGRVLEVLRAAIKLQPFEDSSKSKVYAVASDLTVFKSGVEVDLQSLQPGDRVKLVSESRGNRQDGWQPLVVRVEVDPVMPPGVRERAENGPQTTLDEDTTDVEMRPAGKYEREFEGIVTEIQGGTISFRRAIENGSEETTLPVDSNVSVYRDGLVGNLSLLKSGLRVKMIGQSRGNRQDGYGIVVERITVVSTSPTAAESE